MTKAQPWLSTLARLILAAVWIIAGALKVGDLAGAGRAVNAYKILPYDSAMIVGGALPFMELAIGVLLLIGLATRVAAVVSTALLVVFVVGIASAWARGLRIDCGCFGSGGELAAGQSPTYLLDLLRDGGFLLVAAYLVVWPRSRFSLDNALLGAR